MNNRQSPPLTPALSHLTRVDPRLGDWIQVVGACGLPVTPMGELYPALIRAVAHQQLHQGAAQAILRRLEERVGCSYPAPSVLADLPEADLRQCGFSARKIRTLRELAGYSIPTRAQAEQLSDQALIEHLTRVYGIGPWTVQMMLVFTLGRPDVWPVDDLGVRSGYARVHQLNQLLSPRALAQAGSMYSPYSSTAAWYYWQAADQGKGCPSN